jgi:hypothetical protein
LLPEKIGEILAQKKRLLLTLDPFLEGHPCIMKGSCINCKIEDLFSCESRLMDANLEHKEDHGRLIAVFVVMHEVGVALKCNNQYWDSKGHLCGGRSGYALCILAWILLPSSLWTSVYHAIHELSAVQNQALAPTKVHELV